MPFVCMVQQVVGGVLTLAHSVNEDMTKGVAVNGPNVYEVECEAVTTQAKTTHRWVQGHSSRPNHCRQWSVVP